jgi:hypothetical protein
MCIRYSGRLLRGIKQTFTLVLGWYNFQEHQVLTRDISSLVSKKGKAKRTISRFKNREDILRLHQSIFKKLKILAGGPLCLHLLQVVYSHQHSLFRRRDVELIVERSKEDWVIFRKFLLEGVQTPLGQGKVWRKQDLSGLPKYLIRVFRSLYLLTLWDKVLIVTIMRFHKLVVFPVALDLSTIIDGQTPSEVAGTASVIRGITSS